MKVSKKLGSKGGVTIPQQLRHDAGLQPGAPLDLETTADGLMIRKHVPTCDICGNVENVANCEGFEICGDCARRVLQQIGIEVKK